MGNEVLPEDVLLNFLLANLRGSESENRPLIVDHPDADVLWQGAYPPEVADLLALRRRRTALCSKAAPVQSRWRL